MLAHVLTFIVKTGLRTAVRARMLSLSCSQVPSFHIHRCHMKFILPVLLFFHSTCSLLVAAAPVDPGESIDPDKAAIEQNIAAYVEAFNKGDAQSLAMQWSENGEYIAPSGEKWQGREQIAANLSAWFSGAKDAKLELVGTEVAIQSPSVAVETGTARVIVPEKSPEETTYKAIHIRTADGWRIDSLSETEVDQGPPSHFEELQQLEWMIGEWSDTDDNADIRTTCRWTTNRNFLTQTFRVYVEGRVDFEGTQVIGWDPHAQAIRSWTFDSDGGFGVGRWTQGEGRWTVQTLSVLPDGRRGSSTNIYELSGDSAVIYRSVGRQIDGELMPGVGPVTVVRASQE